MELYKCFSCQPFLSKALKMGFDEYVSDQLNTEISEWATAMKKTHPKFTYRIVNADSVANPNPKNYNAMGQGAIYTFVHVLYSIE